MKVQLKFKNKVYEDYLIDENGIIYDLNNIPQKTYLYKNRPLFKAHGVHKYVIHSFIGYVEDKVIHHINEDKLDNSLSNLVYMDPGEHMKLHKSGKTPWNKGIKMDLSEEARKKMSDAKKGKRSNSYGKPRSQTTKDAISKSNRGRIWMNNGVVNKRVYPDQIPEGFVRGRI